jgi:hypothetical protein
MNLSTSSLVSVTAKPSLIEDIDFLVKTDSTQYPLADKLRVINMYYYDVVSDIIAYSNNWEWDDTNKTDFPIGTTTLVNAQKDYALPSNFLKLLRVEVLDTSGHYRKVEQFDEQEINIALTEFFNSTGFPLYYREIGNSIELYPAPATGQVTLAAGLKVYYQRTMTEFTNADAANSPGFATPFHRILSIGAAYDYAYTNLLPVADRLKQKLDELRTALREYYQHRNKEVQLKFTPRRSNSR